MKPTLKMKIDKRRSKEKMLVELATELLQLADKFRSVQDNPYDQYENTCWAGKADGLACAGHALRKILKEGK